MNTQYNTSSAPKGRIEQLRERLFNRFFGELRSALSRGPSAQAWEDVVLLIQRMPEGLVDEAVKYTLHHLKRWPHGYCWSHWPVSYDHRDAKQRRLRIAKHLHIKRPPNDCDLDIGPMSWVESLTVCAQGEDAIHCIFGALPHAQLRALQMTSYESQWAHVPRSVFGGLTHVGLSMSALEHPSPLSDMFEESERVRHVDIITTEYSLWRSGEMHDKMHQEWANSPFWERVERIDLWPRWRGRLMLEEIEPVFLGKTDTPRMHLRVVGGHGPMFQAEEMFEASFDGARVVTRPLPLN